MTNREIRRFGTQFAFGVIFAVCLWLALSVVFQAGIDAVGLRALDATDNANGARSGVRLRTDHGTGCQYLETSGGGITPRLGRDGVQVC